MTQAHHDWLESVARTVAEDFERLRATAAASSANVQQVGHGGDSPWVILLKQCVPPGYEIGRRKYIFAEEGGEEFETDLVVFHPAYPSALRDQERVLAAGVAAAFSVKLTADAPGLQEAARSAAQLSRGFKPRIGSPRGEMLRPFPYGYLAHSHSWKGERSTPGENATRNSEKNDEELSQHLRESWSQGR